MEVKDIILDFVKSKNKKKEIVGLRGLVKNGEYEWSFRYTYIDGDFLSISKIFKVKLKGINKTPSFVVTKKIKKAKKDLIKK